MNFCPPPSDSAATTSRLVSPNGPIPGKKKGMLSFLSNKRSSSRARYGDANNDTKLTTFFESAAKIKIKRASHPQTFVSQ